MSATATKDWVCSTCGKPGAQPLPGYTAFDSRYTTGYCDNCTDPHPAKPRKTPRPTFVLQRADVFDAEVWQATKDKARLRTLVAMASNGKSTFQMSDKDAYDLCTLFDKYGSPGFVVLSSVRAAAAKYSTPVPTKKKR